MQNESRVRKAAGLWVVRAGGAVLGESRKAIAVESPDTAPVIYFPRDDLAMAMMDRSDTVTTHPYKGQASHYSLVTGAGTIRDAAWSYEVPNPGFEAIANLIAFHPDKVTVEAM